jgi:hypothetical protein
MYINGFRYPCHRMTDKIRMIHGVVIFEKRILDHSAQSGQMGKPGERKNLPRCFDN